MSEIQNLVRSYYKFAWRLDTSSYVVDLLYNDKYLYNNITNMSNWGHNWDNMPDKIIGLRAIFSLYY